MDYLQKCVFMRRQRTELEVEDFDDIFSRRAQSSNPFDGDTHEESEQQQQQQQEEEGNDGAKDDVSNEGDAHVVQSEQLACTSYVIYYDSKDKNPRFHVDYARLLDLCSSFVGLPVHRLQEVIRAMESELFAESFSLD